MIEGENEVRTHLHNILQRVEEELFDYIKGIEKEFLTFVLSGVFDILPRRIKQCKNELDKRRHLMELHSTLIHSSYELKNLNTLEGANP